MGGAAILMRPARGRIDSSHVPLIAAISGVAGDLVAVVLGLVIFAVLLLVLEGIDRI
jgi:hypothetical protein